tara:strand:+ start:1885 stop:2061 length:177 start_codon:yes stop_codon:yes gene_type:complete
MVISILKIIRIGTVIGSIVLVIVLYQEIGIINKRNRQRMIFWECPTKHCYLAKNKVTN